MHSLIALFLPTFSSGSIFDSGHVEGSVAAGLSFFFADGELFFVGDPELSERVFLRVTLGIRDKSNPFLDLRPSPTIPGAGFENG
jgi:hypothetical protein